MPVEPGDRVRLELTLSEGDPLAWADGRTGEVLERTGPNTVLVEVADGERAAEVMAATHELAAPVEADGGRGR